MPPAYNPVSDRNDSKQELKEIEIQKESGYREQDFVQAASGLKKPRNTEMHESVQAGQQQGKQGSARKHQNLCLLCFWFFFRNEITARGDQAEDEFRSADHPGSGSRNDFPFRFSRGNPISQRVPQFMKQHGQETKQPDKDDSYKVMHTQIHMPALRTSFKDIGSKLISANASIISAGFRNTQAADTT